MPVRFTPKRVRFQAKPEKKSETPVADIAEQAMEKIKAVVAGANVLVPFSDQISASSVTIKQVLSGEITLDEVPNAFTRNVDSVVAEKDRLRQEEPIATAIGTAGAAVGQAALTGGASLARQAAVSTAQTFGAVSGDASARGASPEEAASEGLKAAAIGSVLMAAPGAVGATKKAVKSRLDKVLQNITGLDAEERLGRSTLKLLGASKAQSTNLVNRSPELARTVAEEGIISSGYEPKSKIFKNTVKALNDRGQQIKSVYSHAKSKVADKEIASRLMRKAAEIEAENPVANDVIVRKLKSSASKFDSAGKVRSVKDSWQQRVKFDEKAFKNSPSFTQNPQADAQAVNETIRDTIQESINDKIAREYGAQALDDISF